MNETWIAALAALAGALIGAAAALGAQGLVIRQQRRSDRRRELVDLVARFWEATDRIWRSAEGLEYAVIALTNAEAARGLSESVAIYEERRQDSLRRQHEAEVESRFLLAQMRVLHPPLAQPATWLLTASREFRHSEREDLRETRMRALGDYEAEAKRLLGDSRRRKQARQRST